MKRRRSSADSFNAPDFDIVVLLTFIYAAYDSIYASNAIKFGMDDIGENQNECDSSFQLAAPGQLTLSFSDGSSYLTRFYRVRLVNP
jgi:hypothetical protein